MTTARWDALPPNWAVTMRPTTDTHFFPLERTLRADMVWRNLTRPQRELLLSCAGDAPIKARADVIARLVQRGLISDRLTVTDEGREIIQWRAS